MSPDPQQQTIIRELLLQQSRIYDQAIPIAETLALHYDVSQERQEQLTSLDQLMKEAGARYQEMIGITGANIDPSHSEPVKEASAHLARQIERLMPLINRIEQRAQEAKKRLYPELNESIRARKMHAAYANTDSSR